MKWTLRPTGSRRPRTDDLLQELERRRIPYETQTETGRTLPTIHANSAEQAIARFTNCVLQSSGELPYAAVRSSIADSIHLLLHMQRRQGRRYVTKVLEIKKYDPRADRYQLQTVYQRNGGSR